MWPYLLCFVLSCFFTWKASNADGKEHKKRFLIYSVISILLPSILAGARNNTVGTDMQVYGDYYFHFAQKTGFLEFVFPSSGEYLYNLLVYTISHLSTNIFWQYFAFELLVVIFVFLALYENNKRTMWFGMAIYYLLFFNTTLNYMRQSIAIALILYAYKYIKERDFKKYLTFVIISFLFHSSGVIAIFLYLLNILLTKPNYSKKSKNMSVPVVFKTKGIAAFIELLVIFISILIVVYATNVVQSLQGIQVFNGKYDDYFNTVGRIGGIDIVYIAFFMPFILWGLLNRKYLMRNNLQHRFVFSVFCIGYIISQLVRLGGYIYRINMYFSYFAVLYIPEIIYSIKNRKQRIIFILISIFILFLYWYYYYIFRLNNETYPYTSNMLGIY